MPRCPCCVQELPFNDLEALSHLYNCLHMTMLETVRLYENLRWPSQIETSLRLDP